MAKDLTRLPLADLHIYKQNAFQTLANLERMLGNIAQARNDSYDYTHYRRFGDVYRRLEEEMNDRIMNIVEDNELT